MIKPIRYFAGRIIFTLCIVVIIASMGVTVSAGATPPYMIKPTITNISLQNAEYSGFSPLNTLGSISSKIPVTVTSDPAFGYEYASDQVIVRYNTQKLENDRVLKATILNSNAKIGAFVEKDFSNSGLPGMQVVKIPQTITVDDAIAEYRKNPDVLYAEPNYIYHISGLTPNDPFYGNQWGLHNTVTPGADIAAPDAWGISTGSSDVVVAIIDTGVDYNHPDLAANMWTNTGEIPENDIDDDGNGYIDDVRGWNFFDNESDPMDEMTYLNTYHGTHCSGIIGAVGNNGVGISGVNWHVKIMPLRVADEDGSLYLSDAIVAINYANVNGADIISNSWGGLGYSQALKDAITSSPAVVVCAAGNYASSTPERNNDITPIYPASYVSDNIIAVAATDSTDSLASFSHYGQISVDLAAPGVSIYSTNKSSGSTSASYQYMSGTSMATPYVSGLAALVKSVNPRLTNLQIKEIILNNVDVIPSLSGKVNTSGRLNAKKAVYAARVSSPIIQLSPGWNFISTPTVLKEGSDTADIVFAGVDTDGHSIFLYNASTKTWQAMTASSKVKVLDGIWIFSKTATTVPLTADPNPLLVPGEKTLSSGWNAIGFSDSKPATAWDTLSSVRTKWSTAMGFDGINQQYETSFINGGSGIHSDYNLMNPAKGYWLGMMENGTLLAIGA